MLIWSMHCKFHNELKSIEFYDVITLKTICQNVYLSSAVWYIGVMYDIVFRCLLKFEQTAKFS